MRFDREPKINTEKLVKLERAVFDELKQTPGAMIETEAFQARLETEIGIIPNSGIITIMVDEEAVSWNTSIENFGEVIEDND